jgi:hypothetical protein
VRVDSAVVVAAADTLSTDPVAVAEAEDSVAAAVVAAVITVIRPPAAASEVSAVVPAGWADTELAAQGVAAQAWEGGFL